ncbi:MAG TPA: PTS sugar transporter subunit IIA [Vicinamibacterales bacterium]|nr:PTS sugar transporter subunit IIA [Vicinamibacterales bacterium]
MPDRPSDRPDDPPTAVNLPRAPLVGVVVVTHGQLATELVNAAEMIVGELSGFVAVSIGWHDDVETAREAIAAAIRRVARPAGVIVLTDMFGGTPANLGLPFLAEQQVEVITGVNLPMLLKLAGLRQATSLLHAAQQTRESGRNAIWVASDLMRGSPAKDAAAPPPLPPQTPPPTTGEPA